MKFLCRFSQFEDKNVTINIDSEEYLDEVISHIEKIIMKKEKYDFIPHVGISEEYYNIFIEDQILPYILNMNGEIEWHVPYNKVKTEDLCRTFNINDEVHIDVLIGIGGVDDLITSIIKLWDIFIKIITPLIMLKDTVEVFNCIKTFLTKKKCKPIYFISYIYSKDSWNLYELSKQTNIEKDNLKKILKGLGYEWDKKALVYKKTEKSKKIFEEIQRKIYDNNVK